MTYGTISAILLNEPLLGGGELTLAGLQKLTLLDFPGKMACTVFTAGCNFKCPFCHNGSLAKGESDNELTTEEVLSFLKKRQGMLDGVVITGGEPLLHKDIIEFIRQIKKLGFLVKLDTNGTNPEMLTQLVNENLLDYVAMDIKSSPENLEKSIGTNKPFLETITKSKDLLLKGKVPYEFRTTVVKGIHSIKEFKKIGEFIKGAENYFLQCYKESPDILSPNGLSAFSKSELKEMLNEVLPFVKSAKLRGV